MPEKNSMFFPPVLLILDIIGTVLLGLGLAKHFAHIDVIPATLRFENYGPVLIGVGAALMLPIMVHIVNRAKNGAQDRHV
ncbi:MAG: DUF1418 family protein [Sulfuricaulis sp.]